VECRVRRKDGDWIWVHDRAVATYEKNGIRYAGGGGFAGKRGLAQ
jgi:hypothetical protein